MPHCSSENVIANFLLNHSWQSSPNPISQQIVIWFAVRISREYLQASRLDIVDWVWWYTRSVYAAVVVVVVVIADSGAIWTQLQWSLWGRWYSDLVAVIITKGGSRMSSIAALSRVELIDLGSLSWLLAASEVLLIYRNSTSMLVAILDDSSDASVAGVQTAASILWLVTSRIKWTVICIDQWNTYNIF